MATSAGTLVIGTKVDFSKLKSSLRQVTRAVASAAKKMSTAFAGIAKGLIKALLGITAILAGGLIWGIKEAIDYESAMFRLSNTLIATGRAAGFTKDELVANAKEIQATTTTSETAALALQGILLSFTRIKGDNFKRAIRSILDLSAGMAKVDGSTRDAAMAAKLLGRALDDPVKGLTTLESRGLKFSDQQKKMIVLWSETNQLAKAQTLIMDEVERRFGGLGTSVDTTAQKLTRLKNAWTDFLKAFGMPLLGALSRAAESLTKFFEEQTEKVEKFFDLFQTAIAISFKTEGFEKTMDKLIELISMTITKKTKQWFESLVNLLIPLFTKLGELIGDSINNALPEFLRRKSKEELQTKLKEVSGKKKFTSDEAKEFLKQFPAAFFEGTLKEGLQAQFTKDPGEIARNQAVRFLEKQIKATDEREQRVPFVKAITDAHALNMDNAKKINDEIAKPWKKFFEDLNADQEIARKKRKEAKEQTDAENKRKKENQKQDDDFARDAANLFKSLSPRLSAIGAAMQSESRKLFTGARGGQLVATTASELFGGTSKITITEGDKRIVSGLAGVRAEIRASRKAAVEEKFRVRKEKVAQELQRRKQRSADKSNSRLR